MKGIVPRIANRDYTTNSTLRWMHKDLSYALEQVVHSTTPMPTAAVAREIYRLAMARGLADADYAAVAEVLRR